MAETALQQLSIEDFFAWQERQEERYELVEGFPVRMMSCDCDGALVYAAMEYREKLARWLREGLKQEGKRGKELAARLGIQPSAVSRMSSGEQAIKGAHLGEMADYLGLDLPPPRALQPNSLAEQQASATRVTSTRSGTSEYHDRVVTNVLASLHAQLRGTGCRPTTADIAVRTRIRSIRRPDITVTSGAPRKDSYEAENPRMVVEVLSPSNVGVIWQRKLEEYRRLEGLDYILLIDSRLPQATLLVREGGEWLPVDADDLDAVIDCPAIACRLAMHDIYDGLSFDEAG